MEENNDIRIQWVEGLAEKHAIMLNKLGLEKNEKVQRLEKFMAGLREDTATYFGEKNIFLHKMLEDSWREMEIKIKNRLT